MLRFTVIIIACFTALTSNISHAHNTSLTHVKVCGDAIDWPPYTYIIDEQTLGYDIEILDEALMKKGVSYDITMTSWSRCLRGTKMGEFDLAVSASYNTARDKDYLYTEWYYNITPYYIYSLDRFPQGLTISDVKELTDYKVCGNHGYNYTDFNLNNIIRAGNSVKDALDMLERGDCEVYLNWVEIIDGIKSVWGIDYVQDGLVAEVVPNMRPHKFYMLISKKFPAKAELKATLDPYFTSMQAKHSAQ